MSDISVNKDAMQVTCKLERGNETTSRSFSVDNALYAVDTSEAIQQFRLAATELANFLTGEGNKLIQPAGWRDDDSTEAEWTTTSVEIKTVSSTTTTLDLRTNRTFTYTLGNETLESPIITTPGIFEVNSNDSLANPQLTFGEETNFTGRIYGNDTPSTIRPFNFDIDIDAIDDDTTSTVVATFPETAEFFEDTVVVTIVGG